MAIRKNFTEQEKKTIEVLLSSGSTNKEIAEKLKRHTGSVSVYVRNNHGKNGNYLKRISKHSHLHKEVLEYFVGHSFNQTAKYFKLTESELKSCMALAYKKDELKYLRKDNRQNHKRYWSEKEIITMLRLSGILNRDLIAKILNRGNARVIKEKLKKLKVSSRNINGINLSQFIKSFGFKPSDIICGNAGPSSVRGRTYFKIILWVDLEEMIINGKIKTYPFQENLIASMANFQKWLWDGKDIKKELRSIIKKYI